MDATQARDRLEAAIAEFEQATGGYVVATAWLPLERLGEFPGDLRHNQRGLASKDPYGRDVGTGYPSRYPVGLCHDEREPLAVRKAAA